MKEFTLVKGSKTLQVMGCKSLINKLGEKKGLKLSVSDEYEGEMKMFLGERDSEAFKNFKRNLHTLGIRITDSVIKIAKDDIGFTSFKFVKKGN